MSENVEAKGRPLVLVGRVLISPVIILLALSATMVSSGLPTGLGR